MWLSRIALFFFFSSRRRHTRWNCDWSSDVCSSDLYPERFREILMQFIAVPPPSEVIDLYCAAVASTPRVALEGTMHMFNDLSIVEKAQQIRVPTLVIGPTLAPLMNPDYFRQNILALIPGTRLALLNCGHEIPIEMPQAAAGRIEAFLAGLGSEH